MTTQLKFDEVKQEKVKFLKKKKDIVLATSLDNRVTARTVTYFSEGLTIVFFTGNNSKKIAQIKANPKVALCIDNMCIEGLAEIVGGPQEEESKRLIKIYKKKLPGLYEWWFAHHPEIIIFVKVTPTLIMSMVEKNDKPFLEYLDLKNQRAYLKIPWKDKYA